MKASDLPTTGEVLADALRDEPSAGSGNAPPWQERWRSAWSSTERSTDCPSAPLPRSWG
jgi:hypothetical protein